MKKMQAGLMVLAAVGLCILGALSLRVKPTHAQGQPALSYAAGTFYAPAYSRWGAYILSGNGSTGSQTITVCPAYAALPDGRVFSPFLSANSTFAPITVDAQSGGVGSGGPGETVTPTAISIVAAPTGASGAQTCANVTATFSYTHGASYSTGQVISGDQGILEAVNDASSQGGGNVFVQADTGNVTLSTSGATNTTTAQVPTAFFVGGASCRVLTTVTTATSYSLGTSGTTNAFIASSTQLTAGNVQQITFLPAAGSKLGSTTVPGTALTPVVITASATPGAGALHCRVWGYVPAQSNF
jgi:hypothetical protein